MNPEAMREVDRFLRRAAVIGPLIGMLVGFCAGFVSAVVMFRDHEKRITNVEVWIKTHDLDQLNLRTQLIDFMASVRERLRMSK